ncbi:MAG: hypothetical protein KAW56_01385 [Candidatus Marinimicrobia bacterium]|nr:hypothetical protein [Candidatus Neomarinimicrobiota bacterium]
MTLKIKITILISFLLFCISCEKEEWNNPLDPNSDISPDEWAPKNLITEQIDITKVKLTWKQDEKRIEGFKIDRKIGSNAWQNEYALIEKDTKELIDTLAVPDSLNKYRLYAYAGDRNSSVIEKVVTTAFPAPTNLSAEAVSDQSISLKWDDNCTFEDGYGVERKEEKEENFTEVAVLGENATSYNDEGLIYGKTYAYRVNRFTNLNYSDYSLTINATIILSAPTNITALAISNNDIKLSWQDNSTFEEGFRIERKENDGNFEQFAELGANVSEYNDIGLSEDIFYTYRVYAFTSSHLSEYSNVVIHGVGITDIDGNVYKIVKIGNQWWMAENLKVTHYRNGDPIPHVTSNSTWEALNTGAYCNYDNDANNVTTYGRLYNWYAVNYSRNIAPEGWHVSSDAEWKTLEMYLGMSQSDADDDGFRGTDEGGKLKEAGTTHWQSPNTGATNESGFSALPGGYRHGWGGSGAYYDMGGVASFWSPSTSFSEWYRTLQSNYSEVCRHENWRQCGFSVRCVRD